jgi:hypothetical protein
MSEEIVSNQLATIGLTNSMGVGFFDTWCRYYGLSDGTELCLSYRSRELTNNIRWKNGVLWGAFIKSNNVNIVFIIPTNAP